MFNALVLTVLVFFILILGVILAAAIFVWIGVGIYRQAEKEGKNLEGTKFPQEILDVKHLGKKVLVLLFLWVYLVVLLFQEMF